MLRLGLQAQPVLRVERGELGELEPALRACSASMPLTVSSRTSALNFSRALAVRGCRTAPVIASPLRRPYLRTMGSET